MKKIKNIVVATDFSNTANNAFEYVIGLAYSLNASLTLLTVKENVIMVSDVMMTPFPLISDDVLIKKMEKIIDDGFRKYENIKVPFNIQTKVLKGNPADVLINLSNNLDIDLIVMGATGASNILTKIFGSTSIKVSANANCPVLLVPHDAKWRTVEQIMYAANSESLSKNVIHEVIDFAKIVKADVQFVNVKNFDPVFEIKQKEINWNELFENVDDDLYFDKHTIYGNNTIVELKKYCKKNNIDLMVFVSMNRNFWKNLVHKSVTENMETSTTIPMMVLHLEDKL